ncbi:polysaccharide deacetylase family protein [Rhodopirellula sp. JC639]|uniref:polysaccharide deacetylase family protein n=1 Tax=Stieleria mannarensis TaxID=2755585 RepID=UPI0015FFA1FC|nr:polysaccharide deacetylase family protein [Rhodopirellula sp. JC639]
MLSRRITVTRVVCNLVLLTAASASVVATAQDDKSPPSARHRESIATNLTEGGVVFTFDDRNFDDWVRAIPLFDEFSVKATFFISGPIDAPALAAINQLKKHGHAIGSHSVHHLKAVEYFRQNSSEQFLRQEIDPQLDQLAEADVKVTSFAYPMSRNNAATDSALLGVFRHVRTGRQTQPLERLSEVDDLFIPAKDIARRGCLHAKGIDYAPDRPDRTFEQLDAALARAAHNDEIIVFYAHRISESGPGHFVTPDALRRIFTTVRQLGLATYTCDQLP